MKSKKPPKEVLEKDLRAGLRIAVIARKYEGSSVQSVHNWIKAYGLAGIQGQKKPISEKQTSAGDDFDIVADQVRRAKEIITKPILEEMVQESPTLAEIEQFHTDAPVQEFSKAKVDEPLVITEDKDTEVCGDQGTEIDPVGYAYAVPAHAPLETVDEIWLNVHDKLVTIERLSVAQARKSFRERLADLVTAVAGHKKVESPLRGGENTNE